MAKSPLLARALVVLLAVGFVAWAGRFIYESSFIAVDGQRRFCLFDDAMISMRYAHNLTLGHGLVWNPGERLEGITNLLMTLLMALGILAFGKFSGVLAVQVAGVAFVLVVAFSCIRIGGFVRGSSRGASVLPAVFFACGLACYPLCYWSLMGMETGLLAALLFAAVAEAMRVDGSGRVGWALPVLLGLALWTRPDAALPALLILLFRGSGVFRRQGWRRVVAVEAGLVGLFGVVLSIFRLAYYGSLVPNTYVLKMTGWSAAQRVENGVGYMVPVLANLWPLVLMGLAGAALIASRHTALLAALAVASMGYQVYIGGDATPMWRQMALFFPLFGLLAVVGTLRLWDLVGRLAARLPKRGVWSPTLFPTAALWLASAGVVFSLAQAQRAFAGEILFRKPAFTLVENARMANTGLLLERLSTPEASVGVLWAGAIPYFAGRPGVDFLGRCDHHIARLEPDTSGSTAWGGMKVLPGHNKYDLNHSIVKMFPTYVQASSWGRDNLDAFVRRHYELVHYEGVLLRLKKGSPHIRWSLLGAS